MGPAARHLYAPRGDAFTHTGDGELFDRNVVDIVTDKAEYGTRSVSAREVGW